ncbi:MAG: S1C family serine protease [Planctomycetota bacterium]
MGKTLRIAWTGLLLLLAAGTVQAQGEDRTHRGAYEKTRGGVVAIRAMAPLGERSGSGVILDEKGTILTSYSVCPKGARKIRIWTAGPKLYRQEAEEVEILGFSKRDEVALLRIRPREGTKLEPVAFGASASLRVGDICYTSGNAANSIINDGQPSFNAGIVSGFYRLKKARATSVYTGPVIETTAAVNVKMEGAPLFDREGRMVGFVTLNYSPHRFLGCAIPIDGVRQAVEAVLKRSDAAAAGDAPAGKGYVGMELEEKDGGVVVKSVVEDGPAHRAGLRAGDVLVAVGEKRLGVPADFWALVKDLEAGSVVFVKVRDEDGGGDRHHAGEETGMKRMLPVAAFLAMCAGASAQDPSGSFERVLRKLREKAAPSVVAVVVDRAGAEAAGTGRGSMRREYYSRPKGPTTGTIVGADGFILTSHFNVAGEVRGIRVVLHDGTKHKAELLGYDKVRDVALLKIDAKDLPVLPRAAAFRQGDLVAVVGRSPDPRTATLNCGVISAVHRQEDSAVQTDAELNYGNVGGPLVNLKGEIVGVTCHTRARTNWGQSGGIGFAAKMSVIDALLPRLKKGERIEKKKKPWLGIRPGEGDVDVEGVQVGEVFEDSPAAKAGLRIDDVITHVDGAKVADPDALRKVLQKKKIGEKVKLTVVRKSGEGREEMKVEIELEEEPD